VSHPSRRHRALDVAHAEAAARDGDQGCRSGTLVPGHGGALLPSKTRLRDVRTLAMSRPRVLLTKLSIRTSAKGNTYLSGRLGQAHLVGFKGEPDKFGNDVWDVYVSEPDPRPATAPEWLRERQEKASAAGARGSVDPDWDSTF
jgi:hypothetical protein